MNLMRAIAQYYAELSGLTVPAVRFTEGQRSQLDTLPAITYQRVGTTEDYTQRGPGLITESVQMTVWAETPGQADRIARELYDHFHLLRYTTIGTGADAVDVKECRRESQIDNAEYPLDEGAAFPSNSASIFEFVFSAPNPKTIP